LPLPPLQAIPQETQIALIQQAQMQALQGLPNGGPLVDPVTQKQYILDMASGQILEIRSPTSITERLQAQALMGIGMVANSAGRKASGDSPPKMESKGDEPGGRTTVTESKK
jgi:hypothetical protein